MDFNAMKKKEDNIYSVSLFIMGFIYIILGVIGAFVLGDKFETRYGDFNLAVFSAALFCVLLFAALILGLAEIIRILNDNRRLLATIACKETDPADNNNIDMGDELPEL